MSTEKRKVIRESDTFWQLDGESDLSAITLPDPPLSGIATTVRLTHSNSYGPFDEADFYVRVGNTDKPTDQDDLDSASDWVKAQLIEELVTVDDEEMLRSEAESLSNEDEIPWQGTYDALLIIPAGRHSIEIKVWHRLLRRLSIIRAWNTWIARIATGGCVGVFFSYSQGWWIVLLMVAVLAWQLSSSADSQIKMLESFRARHGLRSEPKTPVA